MIELLTFCLCVSLITLTIYASIHWEGMILHWAKKYLDKLPKPIATPLYGCIICMASVWTTIFWFAYKRPFSLYLFVAILIVGGMNTLLSIILENLTEHGS